LANQLYSLLPAVHRIRDTEEGEPLRALLAAIDEEVLAPIEAQILALRDGATIETCPDWAIPYLADLLGARPLRPGGPGSGRAYVANTLAYRRRKGTAAVLEQLARDVTGLPAHAVEFFELLAATQFDDHVRPHRPGTLDLRSAERAERVGGPFEDAPYTVEVRRAATQGGRYNLPHVGIFLWRLASFAVERAAAYRVGPGQFTVHPLGLDGPLYNRPQTEAEITHLAQEQNVPEPLRRLALNAELEALRAGQPRPAWFGAQPVVRLYRSGEPGEPAVDPVEIHICNLADWRRPPAGVALDPDLGRIALPEGEDPPAVLVSSAYGFAGEVGAGPAPRPAAALRPATWQVGVSLDHPAVGLETVHTSLQDAVQEWNSLEPGQAGRIVIMDSRTYDLGATPLEIVVKEGSQLLITGGRWPALERAGAPGALERRPGGDEPRGERPCLLGGLLVTAPNDGDPGELVLDGLLLSGALTVAPGNLDRLHLRYSTLAPRAHGDIGTPPASLSVDDCPRLVLELERAISGPVVVQEPIAALALRDAIVAAEPGGLALDAPLAPAAITASTLLGDAVLRSIETRDSLYLGACVVQRRQEGCARFSYFGPGSRTPRRYRCQPDLALARRAEALAPEALPPAEAALIQGRLRPQFVSTRYGHPGFAQLDMRTTAGIRTGAESGAEMGAFEHRKLALGERNLLAVLDEYLPFGLQAGIFYRS
jgi:hypothetical protein